ncbi:MAG: putative RND superfamily exporter protein [Colwellia sp.]|jgi:predicted RND superfamily exporter protein|uniref:efflux RND transporter permease subunit n=1 Tax=unclassified Colwellia TaxID=196834 RepID=UPI0015F3A036|nr:MULTISPECIES: MMPL family transporter [unclassified Colwellia]MBA6349029.1 MMPL family transporter [Colwellia sp. BRX8-9]MBA6351990.1 MMPL family transporter [Colwellia sp. BRX9-1]MBA6355004.1 MMPL family transporter [Colwellia sp. BRX8-3]MBA6359891.1 MMPL family transporter [Colwellia sp. BRX8-6]MBA6366906.1 MMPL family transporter [Colwellia sp. BRX8-5]
MKIESLINVIEATMFRKRVMVLVAFVLASIFLVFQASQIKLDAAFEKHIPLNHTYMKTYLEYRENFGGANNVLISVCDTEGDIFNESFFGALKGVHDQLFFIPGVDRIQVKSLYSPSTRFVEIVEDGFAGGPVIPANFQPDSQGLAVVKANIEKAGIVGSIVADDYSCAMVKASLMDTDPQTGARLDTLVIAEQLEQQIRGKFEKDNISIHIIGFSKMVGDVAEGAKGVVAFFAIAIVITTLMVFWFCRSISLTLLPIACSLVAVVWQLGMLSTLGFGLDPMSILVPFLVFAIGVSHGVQMINSVSKLVSKGATSKEAAQMSFRLLLIPGGIALLSDTVGFLTLLSIDIGIIRELAITASLGVAMIILTNLILLPLLVSFIHVPKVEPEIADKNKVTVWDVMSSFATKRIATVILVITAVLYAAGYYYSQDMKIGELHAGAPSLHETSRYNQDTFLITDRYAISVDYMSVIVESPADSCTFYETMDLIDTFQWQMENTVGVQSAISLASVAKIVNAGYNEGNARWRVLSRNQQTLVQSIARIPSTSGLLNSDCSVMPVILFLEDHKAETINRVVDKVKVVTQALETDEVKFKLASGPVGVMAATNEAVAEAQTPMMLYVYGAVTLLCFISFRSVRATIVVIVPLYVVSTLAQWLMTALDIGLTVSTLPVIALGVGIGVDYGIYILSTMSIKLREGYQVQEAYLLALKERGSAVLITGVTLAIGVSTWFWSDLKFQVDMGILLTFMFLVNMIAAVLVLPAIAAFLWPNKK